MENQKHPIYFKSIIGCIIIISFGIYYLNRGIKNKNEFLMTKGTVTYIENTFEELPIRHKDKFRFLKIDNHNKVLEIFIGKDFGDFKPQFEDIDRLKIGDTISIYYDVDFNESDSRLNRSVQFIDLATTPVYVRGGKDKLGGMLAVISGIAIFLLLFYLKRIGVII